MATTVIGVLDAGTLPKVTAELHKLGFKDGDIEVVSGSENQILRTIVEAGFDEKDARSYIEDTKRGKKLLAARGEQDRVDRALKIIERYEQASEKEGSTEETLQEVEEELSVGKRRVIQGGLRATTHVTEQPVEETVKLRTEHVDVEHRPVDRKLSSEEAEEAFQEKTIEMTETAEKADVQKEARVVEEVALRKTTEEHEEKIRDTVRRTDVEVEELKPSSKRSKS